MLKVDIREEGKGLSVEIESSGSMTSICQDICRVILSAYTNMQSQHPAFAKMFRDIMTDALNSDEFWGLMDTPTTSIRGCTIRLKK